MEVLFFFLNIKKIAKRLWETSLTSHWDRRWDSNVMTQDLTLGKQRILWWFKSSYVPFPYKLIFRYAKLSWSVREKWSGSATSSEKEKTTCQSGLKSNFQERKSNNSDLKSNFRQTLGLRWGKNVHSTRIEYVLIPPNYAWTHIVDKLQTKICTTLEANNLTNKNT